MSYKKHYLNSDFYYIKLFPNLMKFIPILSAKGKKGKHASLILTTYSDFNFVLFPRVVFY